MSGAAGLDLRYPIGGLFTVLGLLLGVYGLATNGNAEMYARSTGVNVNLWWGVIMIAVGVLFLILAAHAGRGTSRPASDSAAGRGTESRERELGLER